MPIYEMTMEKTSYDPMITLESMVDAIIESDINFNNTIRIIGVHELKCMQEGTQVLMEAEDKKSIIEIVKKFIAGLIERAGKAINSALGKLREGLDARLRFVKKYSADVKENLWNVNFSQVKPNYKIYVFKNLDGAFMKTVENASAGAVFRVENEADKQFVGDALRIRIMNRKVTADKFSTELFNNFRDEKTKLSDLHVDKAFIDAIESDIKGYPALEKKIRASYVDYKKNLNQIAKDFEDRISTLKPNKKTSDDDKEVYGNMTTYLKDKLGAVKEVSSIYSMCYYSYLKANMDKTAQDFTLFKTIVSEIAIAKGEKKKKED